MHAVYTCALYLPTPELIHELVNVGVDFGIIHAGLSLCSLRRRVFAKVRLAESERLIERERERE